VNDLPALLVRHRVHLLRHVERRGGPVLRFETVDDLVQSIHLHALEHRDAFQYRGLEPFLAWINEVARRYLKDRRDHWAALKRRPAGLVRLTQVGSNDPGAAAEPAGRGTGPATFAARREQLNLAVRALEMLMPRDRDLVRWTTQGHDDDSIATRMHLERKTAARARQRAVERFRKAYRLLQQSG